MLNFIESVLPSIKPETSIKILDQLLIARFGSLKKAQGEILKISNNGTIDDEGFKLLLKMIYYEQLKKLFFFFIEGEDYISLIKSITQMKESNLLEDLTIEEKRDFVIYLKHIFSNEFFTQLPIFEKKQFSKKVLANKIANFNITSKDKISGELGIDKVTLNKWLSHYFGNRFDGKRKITFEEYIEIMQKLSLSEDESIIL